jgi:hypothetical protein
MIDNFAYKSLQSVSYPSDYRVSYIIGLIVKVLSYVIQGKYTKAIVAFLSDLAVAGSLIIY